MATYSVAILAIFFSQNTKKPTDLLILFYSTLWLITGLLDGFWLSTNLELIGISQLFSLVLIQRMIGQFRKSWTIWITPVLYIGVLLAVFLTEIRAPFIHDEIIYYSDYGFMDTHESQFVTIVFDLFLLGGAFRWLWLLIVDDELQDYEVSKQLVVCFAFLFSISIGLFQTLFGNMLFHNLDEYFLVRSVINRSTFAITYVLFAISIFWKPRASSY